MMHLLLAFPRLLVGVICGSLITNPSIAVASSSRSLQSNAPLSSSALPEDSAASADIQTITERRQSFIVAGATGDSIFGPIGAGNISTWLSTLGPDGKWPDSEIDYTTGCDARRANWPAQLHWIRILTMTAAWHGGMPGDDDYVKSSSLQASISEAMDWWFQNDFANPACLDSGGTSRCPCGTAGMWNTNWFSNIILIPNIVSQSCLLLNDTLTSDQLISCNRFTGRTYATLGTSVNGLGVPTGANLLDIAKIGIDNGLLNQDASLISDAYSKIHAEVVIENSNLADGIRADGSFGQHSGVLYNGNYGKDFANDVLFLEIQAGGTQFAAGDEVKSAFTTLIDGDRWMIFRNILTGVLHWDFSVLGRFIVFPVADSQPTSSISINVTEIRELGQEWDNEVLLSTAMSLSKNRSSANAGSIRGNRMFFNNDYMIQRGTGYVTTLKMFSTRSKNTECINLANPFGFHLSDGTVYTYQQGAEYEDVSSAWDWNLIPGTTTDYGNTPLSCDKAGTKGKNAFVGGVSNGKVGAAAMTYTNPLTSALNWKKAWFFLEGGVQRVMIPFINSSSSAPVLSVLDQKRRNGTILIDGHIVDGEKTSVSRPLSLWHDNIGYTFDQIDSSVSLTVQSGPKTGNWSAIGTSSASPNTVDLFAAWLDQGSGPSSSFPVLSYTAYPAVSIEAFEFKSNTTRVRTIQNDAHISAVYDGVHSTAMVVFWDVTGGSVQFTTTYKMEVTIEASASSAVIYNMQTGTVTVSDPSQTATNLTLGITLSKPRENAKSRAFAFTLPTGGLAGSSVSQAF